MEGISPLLYNSSMEEAAAQCKIFTVVILYCYTGSICTGIGSSGAPVGGSTQRQDPLSSPSEPSDYQSEISVHSLPIEQRSNSSSSYMRAQHSTQFLTGTTTPTNRASLPVSLRLSSCSAVNASPILKSRCLGRSRDDGNEGAIREIWYPPSWGQNQLVSDQSRESPAADFDENYHSAEPHYHMASCSKPKKKTMVSLKCYHTAVTYTV